MIASPPRQAPEAFAEQAEPTYWPGASLCGSGALAFASRMLRGRASRLAVITDAQVWPFVSQAIRAAIDDAGCALALLFDAVQPNPCLADVREAARLARARDCDGFVAVGGGSVIDTAKVVYASVASGLAPDALLLAAGQAWMASDPAAHDPVFVALPTTAGTGSESSTAALIKDDQGRKLMFRSRRSRPAAVALVPEFTLSLPRHATATGGFDAVLHALGAFVNTCPSPAGEALAAGALARALAAYPAVLERPGDLAARAEMQIASHLAGVAIGLKRVDAVHGLCTPLEGCVDAAHAEVLAGVFDAVARFTVQAAAAPYARAARLCGLATQGDGDAQAAERMIEEIGRLRRLGGLPDRLPPLALDHPHALALADQALQSPSTRFNPRPLSRDQIAQLYLRLAQA